MPTLNQLIRHGRKEKRRTDRTRALDQCPQKQGVCLRVSTRTPKKPNSALRKIPNLGFQKLEQVLLEGQRRALIGTARGIDQWAIEWLLDNSESCWAVVPYTRFKQPQWVQPWLEQVDRIVELQLPRRKTAGAIRNRHMVDLSGIVFGFWSGKGGATVKTLKYALRQQREVHAIPIQNRERIATGQTFHSPDRNT